MLDLTGRAEQIVYANHFAAENAAPIGRILADLLPELELTDISKVDVDAKVLKLFDNPLVTLLIIPLFFDDFSASVGALRQLAGEFHNDLMRLAI